MSDIPQLAIRPVEGSRLVLVEAGATTLAGVPLLAGADVPAQGAIVPTSPWMTRQLQRGDAEVVPDADVKAAVAAAAKAAADAEKAAAKAKADADKAAAKADTTAATASMPTPTPSTGSAA